MEALHNDFSAKNMVGDQNDNEKMKKERLACHPAHVSRYQ
jgi:hypothetical protein